VGYIPTVRPTSWRPGRMGHWALPRRSESRANETGPSCPCRYL